jgi:hypothetical protein
MHVVVTCAGGRRKEAKRPLLALFATPAPESKPAKETKEAAG